MPIDNYLKSKWIIYRIVAITCLIIILISLSYFAFYKYQQSKIKILPPIGFYIESETKDLSQVGLKWLDSYAKQYQQKYVPRIQKLVEYSIDNIEIKENHVIQIDFSIVTKRLDERTAYLWNGILEEEKIKCQWVLWFEETTTLDNTTVYKVIKLQRPAGYDLEKYQTSGEKEKDEYKNQYESEIPYNKLEYTYKIENKICYVSYDSGATWKEVPVAIETLTAVGDGRPYYNRLQENSYLITPKKTAFVYGGTREIPLKIIYSQDMGSTWSTAEISTKLNSVRVKFCSFTTENVGYAIASGDRAMSQEVQIIFKTIDGGSTWKEVGFGPSTSLLQSGGFIDNNIGFMSYPKIQGAESNFYRTQDGGKTFDPIILPVVNQEWMGTIFQPFIHPEIPYLENGKLFLLVGQGPQGDFKGGTVMAKYQSHDLGKTWTFIELFEPPSKEIG